MTIYWLSRHPPLPAQERELRRIYGPATAILQDPEPYSSAHDVLTRYRAVDGEKELLAVVPLSMLRHLLREGVRPLWAQMMPADGLAFDPDRDVRMGGNRCSRFVEFCRVTGLNIQREPLEVKHDGTN